MNRRSFFVLLISPLVASVVNAVPREPMLTTMGCKPYPLPYPLKSDMDKAFGTVFVGEYDDWQSKGLATAMDEIRSRGVWHIRNDR